MMMNITCMKKTSSELKGKELRFYLNCSGYDKDLGCH